MSRSGDLIREARLRAGLTQGELAERSGRDRAVIGRWEQGAVAPSVETLIELVRACGFDLPLVLTRHDPSRNEQLEANLKLSPERRLEQLAERAKRNGGFDPRGLLVALERGRVTYILIGALARIVHGADELTHGLDLTPRRDDRTINRLETLLLDLKAKTKDRRKLHLHERISGGEEVIALSTDRGELKVVPTPTGTQGFDDLRRRASREYLCPGVRAPVASIDDLTRMLAARERERDLERLLAMRRLAELERSLGRDLGLDLGL